MIGFGKSAATNCKKPVRHGFDCIKSVSPKYMALAVLALGLLHPAIQWALVATAAARQASLNPKWHGMRYLPMDLLDNHVVVIPFVPQLATLLAFIMLHSLPLIAAYIRTKKGSLREAFPPGFSFLLLLYIYVAGVCNLVEYGENLRFRLPVEPIIWSIGIVTARVLISRRGRSRLQTGISGDRPTARQPA